MVLGIFLSLLYSMESGEVSLECCQRHIGDLSETGVRLSAAFTALSSIIRPPKVKKGKKKKKKKQQQQQQRRARDKEQQQQQQQQEEHRAAATNGAAAAASHGAAAAGGEGLAPRPSPMPPLLDLERAETMDDPFAGLQDARTGGWMPWWAAEYWLAAACQLGHRHPARPTCANVAFLCGCRPSVPHLSANFHLQLPGMCLERGRGWWRCRPASCGRRSSWRGACHK